MTAFLRRTTALTLLLMPACAPAPAAPVVDDGQRMMTHLETRIRRAQDRFLQLAEAVPEAQYDWRPMDGVRSFREVFIHVAADNWAPLWMDVQAPAEVPITRDAESLAAYQQQGLGKEATLLEMRRSFEFILGAIDQTRDQLDQPVMFGGREWQTDEMWVALVTHMHEHLGQTIAYARANGIVPPWSQPE